MKTDIQQPKSLQTNSVIHARFLLNYSNLKRKYSRLDKQAFSLDVDIKLPNNGITAIFGVSGSGKTSLLRCIAGLDKADHGYISVNDRVWQSDSQFLPTHKRPLAYVFQEASLFPHLTAQGNLDYAIKRSDGVTEASYQQVLAVMGLNSTLQRYPNQLSGGERQRVAIARALLIQPQLLLMDEPLASLDAHRKQEILPYLEKLRSAFDIPIFYVSHSLDEITRLADHVVLMDQGKVAAQGHLMDVFSRIDLPFNLGDETGVVIFGHITERDAQWGLARIAFNGGELWVRDQGDAIGQRLRVRLLAKDISLALSSHEDSSILNKLSVKVDEISDDSDASMVLVKLKLGSEYLIARLTKKSLHQLQLIEGKQVWAQIKSVAITR